MRSSNWAWAPRHPLVRFSVGLTDRTVRFAGGALAAVLWFTFVAQIFVAEFLNYRPVVGWLNQPLVQLPWFRYLP